METQKNQIGQTMLEDSHYLTPKLMVTEIVGHQHRKNKQINEAELSPEIDLYKQIQRILNKDTKANLYRKGKGFFQTMMLELYKCTFKNEPQPPTSHYIY